MTVDARRGANSLCSPGGAGPVPRSFAPTVRRIGGRAGTKSEWDTRYALHGRRSLGALASRLEEGQPIEVLELQKPAGAKGFVMKIELEPGQPRVYVKLQLGAGRIVGRSFHYSEHDN